MKLKSIFSLSLAIILLLVSCQLETEPIIATSTIILATNTTVSQSILEVTTSSSSLSLTATRTVMVEPIPAPVPTSTTSATTILEAVTLSPTLAMATPMVLTPLPMLEGEELETQVARLLADPMNCDVPCWWGTIPGVTSINEVKHAISPYNFDIYEYEVESNMYLRLGIGRVKEQNDFEVKIVYGFSDSISTGITAYSPPIPELLVRYGQPDEVWLSAMNDPREQPPLVWFVIVYLQKGIGVGYVVDGNIQNDMVIGCVADKDTERLRRLRLVTPGSVTSYKDFSPIFDKERLYLPLEGTVGLTLEEFMQLFNDSTQPQCIETPIELWD